MFCLLFLKGTKFIEKCSLYPSKKHCANNGFSKRSNRGDIFVVQTTNRVASELRRAQVAELVDAYVSGAYVARRAGSSPVLGTVKAIFIIAGGSEAYAALTRGAGGEIGIHATLRG